MLSVVRPRAFAVLGCLTLWAFSSLSSVSHAQPATTGQAQAAGSGTVAASAAPAPSAVPAGASEEPPLAWDLLNRRYSSWYGFTGGIALVDASTGEPGAVRIQLGLDGYSGSDYLNDDDEIDVRDQVITLSYTPVRVLELYASLTNRAVSRPEPDGRTLDSLGDFSLGAKVSGHLAPTLWLSGDVRALLGGQVGSSGQAWDSTSIGLRAALTLDLQELKKPVPLVGRLNLGYLFDSTANLVSDEESRRYEQLEDPEDMDDETRHLVDRFERLAFGVNRLDKLIVGVGAEVPLQVAENFFLHPIVEYQVGIPVNRQDYDCPNYIDDPNAGEPSSPNDSCFERHPETAPMNLLFGLRVVPPVRGLSLLLSADIGLTGTDMFVRELQPNLPYRLMIAFSYDYDARPVPEKIVTVKEPAPAPLPAAVPSQPTGRVQGVVATADGLAVAGAIVTFKEHPNLRVASGTDGTFLSEPLPPGVLTLEVTHPDYENASCAAAIPEAGGDVGVRCVMLAKPRQGGLAGRVSDSYGSPLPGARVVLTGPGGTLVMTDSNGAFEIPQIVAGDYSVRVEASGYFSRQTTAQVLPRVTSRLEVNLARKPSKSGITLRPDSTVEAPALTWTGETVQLSAAGEQAVAELAELLLTRPDLKARIQTPGTELVAQPRADMIKQRLIAAGVEASRVEAVGGGQKLRITVHP
ncbi:MAG TPA: carboxypeptidase regulatory-like domain-containing protein [Polyangiales bacterium]|nr:carboxypeptidase regulatory-like domain-containing protein [Polyangiales bacterium]